MSHGRHRKAYSFSCIVLCTLYGNKHSSVACSFKILLSVTQFSKCGIPTCTCTALTKTGFMCLNSPYKYLIAFRVSMYPCRTPIKITVPVFAHKTNQEWLH